jgi:uncharacterized protein (DUF1697 family)
MTNYAALLRAVNLGPHNKVPMSELRSLLGRLGMKDAQTLLQSGNAVFRCDDEAAADVEQRLESACTRHLKVTTHFFIRTAKELKAAIAANPFPRSAELDPSHLLVLFMKDAPNRASVSALQSAIVGREVVKTVGRQACFVYPDGIGNSKLTSALIEKKLATRGTARNWNTVLKLTALLDTL